MAIVALAVSVVLFAALAVVFWHFYHTLDRRIAAILACPTPDESRFTIPEELKNKVFDTSSTGELDVTGAWAEEQRRLGIEISDEEIDEQRRMWLAEGVA